MAVPYYSTLTLVHQQLFPACCGPKMSAVDAVNWSTVHPHHSAITVITINNISRNVPRYLHLWGYHMITVVDSLWRQTPPNHPTISTQASRDTLFIIRYLSLFNGTSYDLLQSKLDLKIIPYLIWSIFCIKSLTWAKWDVRATNDSSTCSTAIASSRPVERWSYSLCLYLTSFL